MPHIYDSIANLSTNENSECFTEIFSARFQIRRLSRRRKFLKTQANSFLIYTSVNLKSFKFEIFQIFFNRSELNKNNSQRFSIYAKMRKIKER